MITLKNTTKIKITLPTNHEIEPGGELPTTFEVYNHRDNQGFLAGQIGNGNIVMTQGKQKAKRKPKA